MELTAYAHAFPCKWHFPRKILLVMKLTAVFILAATLQLSAKSYSQKVTLSIKGKPMSAVFKMIGRQTGYEFIMSPSQIGDTKVTLDEEDASLDHVLADLLGSRGLTYTIRYNTIIVTVAAVPAQQEPVMAERSPTVYEFKGRVTDSTGTPLSGATVTVRETNNAVQTDQQGIFTLRDYTQFPTLVFSFIGYAPKTIKVQKNGMALLLVILRASDNPLDEIQITAYGKTSKRLSTGDITTITSEEIAQNPVPNVLEAIQGRVPGMFITQQTGQPGGAFTVQVRSQQVLGNQNTNPVQLSVPLYIVDGVTYPVGWSLPMLNGALSAPGSPGGGNALNYLDPSVIESVTVLKGPDATAIYGSRGSNGVIIITTKKGLAGKPRLNMSVYTGTTAYGPGPQLLNTRQYLALRHNAFANDGTTPGPGDYDVNGTWDTTTDINWRKFLQGHAAMTTKASATYSGGSNNTTFLIGANYNEQGNVQRGLGSVRMGGMNFDVMNTTSDRKFSIDLSGNYTNNLNTMVPFDASSSVTSAPDAPPYFLPNGQVNWAGGDIGENSLAILYKNMTNNLVANTVLTYTPIADLHIKLSGGYTLLSAKEFRGYPSAYFDPATFSSSQENSTINDYSTSAVTIEPNISYKHKLGRKGNFDVTAGGTIQNETDDQLSVSGSDFLSDALLYDPSSAPSGNQSTNYNKTPYRYMGFFGVAHYNWDNKYILNLNGRRDGSTRFGPGKQFGDFGSVGAAWLVSEEKWFKALRPIIDFAKLTGSYGTTGGQAIPIYQYLNTYEAGSTGYEGGSYLSPDNPANPDLHWSTNKDWDGGVMLGFLKGRINVEGTHYHNLTSGLLAAIPLSTAAGISNPVVYKNSPIVIETSGWEFTVSTSNVKTRDFSWSTSINLTMPHSKLVSFPGGPTALKSQFGLNYILGKPVTGDALYNYKGVDPETGRYFFTNAQGVTGPFNSFSATLNPATDYTQFRDRAPKVYGGMSNTLKYKQVTLTFMFTFTDRIGQSYEGQQLVTPGFANTNYTTLALNRWMKPGDKTNVPAATENFLVGYFSQGNFFRSTGAFENATYARLSNVNIAYAFTPGLLKRVHVSAMSVYLAGQNLLTISKYGDLDPENLSASSLGPLRIFTGGINFTF